MKYQDISIKNFRGIRSLEIRDFKQVNLLVGRNNSGKTSVLEALFLISGMSNPQLIPNIHVIRDMLLTDDEYLTFSFHNLDARNTPDISANIIGAEEKKRELKITPIYGDYSSSGEQKLRKVNLRQSSGIEPKQPTGVELSSSVAAFRMIEGVKFDFGCDYGSRKTWHAELRLEERELRLANDYKEHLRCVFLNPRTIMSDLDNRLGHLLVRKNLGKLISVLKEIEPSISDIRMGANKMIYMDIGLDKLLPINIMGDGTRRILAILSAISDTKNGVLLIDEIENGLHHTSLTTLWKAVFRAAHEFDTQIFATTHSYECIESFAKTESDDFCLYRIDRKGGKHTAYSSDSEVLRAGIEKEFEVR